jgi:hypothetical protein
MQAVFKHKNKEAGMSFCEAYGAGTFHMGGMIREEIFADAKVAIPSVGEITSGGALTTVISEIQLSITEEFERQESEKSIGLPEMENPPLDLSSISNFGWNGMFIL